MRKNFQGTKLTVQELAKYINKIGILRVANEVYMGITAHNYVKRCNFKLMKNLMAKMGISFSNIIRNIFQLMGQKTT